MDTLIHCLTAFNCSTATFPWQGHNYLIEADLTERTPDPAGLLPKKGDLRRAAWWRGRGVLDTHTHHQSRRKAGGNASRKLFEAMGSFPIWLGTNLTEEVGPDAAMLGGVAV